MGTSPMASQSLLMPKPHMSSISAIRFQLVDGRLIFKGKHRLLAVNGLTLVDVGIVKASAHGVRHDNCYLFLPYARVSDLWRDARESNARAPCIMSSPAETRSKEFSLTTAIEGTIWAFF